MAFTGRSTCSRFNDLATTYWVSKSVVAPTGLPVSPTASSDTRAPLEPRQGASLPARGAGSEVTNRRLPTDPRSDAAPHRRRLWLVEVIASPSSRQSSVLPPAQPPPRRRQRPRCLASSGLVGEASRTARRLPPVAARLERTADLASGLQSPSRDHLEFLVEIDSSVATAAIQVALVSASGLQLGDAGYVDSFRVRVEVRQCPKRVLDVAWDVT
jgi:hypothetical protein